MHYWTVLYLLVVTVFSSVDEHAQHQQMGLRVSSQVHQVNLSVVVGGADLFYSIFSKEANRHD